MNIDTPALSSTGLRRFQELRTEAIDAVAERFYTSHGATYAQFGPRGREACREDLSYHLEFLQPVLEFGLIQPMVDYLRWLASVLETRDIPAQHLSQSLDWLGDFFSSHMEASDAEIIVTALRESKSRFLETDDTMAKAHEIAPAPWPECDTFESALLSGNRRTAELLFEHRLRQGHGLVEIEMHLIQSALYGIGKKWQNNQVSVVQEHMATAIAQSLMSRGLARSKVPTSNGRKVLLACVEGNIHSVGLQMVADGFLLAGWEVQFLGANVPTRSLIQHIGQDKPDLLGLSVSFAQQLRVVKEIMAQLTKVHGAARPSVIVGGLAINQFNQLAGGLGTDGWSPDAHSAIATADQLTVQ